MRREAVHHLLPLGVAALLAVQIAVLPLLPLHEAAHYLLSALARLSGVPFNTLLVVLGTACLGGAVGSVGTYAVLRGKSLLGDAVAHAALPGVCVAFLLIGERRFGLLLFGAMVSGWLGTLVVSLLTRQTRLKSDAAIGAVLSVFFAAGLFLSGIIQNDPSARQAGLDSFLLGKTAGMVTLDVVLIAVSALNMLLVLVLFRKEFLVISFDPAYGNSLGLPVASLDVLLLGMLVVATVIGLPAVGVVLIAGMLILPGAAARFWSNKLSTILGVSAVLGAVSGVLGTLVSTWLPGVPTGPVIILVAFALFALSGLFAPQRGALARLHQRSQFSRRVRQENLLRSLYEILEERGDFHGSLRESDLRSQRSWEAGTLESTLAAAQAAGWVEPLGSELRLTVRGLGQAAKVTRTHRLVELYLREKAGANPWRMDRDAETIEHLIPDELLAELEAILGRSGQLPSDTVPASPHGPLTTEDR